MSGVYYRFTPDDGQDGQSTSKTKMDFNFRNSFACANIEVSYYCCIVIDIICLVQWNCTYVAQ